MWPIDHSELALEQEPWEIFVRWNEQYQAGLVSTEVHPQHLGTSKRWGEIDLLLETRRKATPKVRGELSTRNSP